MYHEQCEEARRKMNEMSAYEKVIGQDGTVANNMALLAAFGGPLGGKAAMLLDQAIRSAAKEKGLETEKRAPTEEEQALVGAYGALFWIYEEKRYARWPEYIEFYRKQDEEEGRVSTRVVDNETESAV